jgi:hypothetical protein
VALKRSGQLGRQPFDRQRAGAVGFSADRDIDSMVRQFMAERDLRHPAFD